MNEEQRLKNLCQQHERTIQQLTEEMMNQSLVIRNMIERISKLELTIIKTTGMTAEEVEEMHMPTHDDWTRE